MIKIDEEKTIHLTRGDKATIIISAQDFSGQDYKFLKNDIIRLKVMSKGNVENIVLVKEVEVESDTTLVNIELMSEETRIGDYINKPVTFWYEVELNPDSNSTTIIGYDDDGPKKFKLYPEGKTGDK